LFKLIYQTINRSTEVYQRAERFDFVEFDLRMKQTLQIDGFEQDKKVVVIAATNRKEDLDPALIR
jgi:SpoVK/Ycf46/Vps4 family AAA+-type ATPase